MKNLLLVLALIIGGSIFSQVVVTRMDGENGSYILLREIDGIKEGITKYYDSLDHLTFQVTYSNGKEVSAVSLDPTTGLIDERAYYSRDTVYISMYDSIGSTNQVQILVGGSMAQKIIPSGNDGHIVYTFEFYTDHDNNSGTADEFGRNGKLILSTGFIVIDGKFNFNGDYTELLDNGNVYRGVHLMDKQVGLWTTATIEGKVLKTEEYTNRYE